MGLGNPLLHGRVHRTLSVRSIRGKGDDGSILDRISRTIPYRLGLHQDPLWSALAGHTQIARIACHLLHDPARRQLGDGSHQLRRARTKPGVRSKPCHAISSGHRSRRGFARTRFQVEVNRQGGGHQVLIPVIGNGNSADRIWLLYRHPRWVYQKTETRRACRRYIESCAMTRRRTQDCEISAGSIQLIRVDRYLLPEAHLLFGSVPRTQQIKSSITAPGSIDRYGLAGSHGRRRSQFRTLPPTYTSQAHQQEQNRRFEATIWHCNS